jgi:hypothetical protein
MHFSPATILFGLVASSLASPLPATNHAKRAGVLTQQSYADFQISDGVAGGSVAEVLANFPVSLIRSALFLLDIHAGQRAFQSLNIANWNRSTRPTWQMLTPQISPSSRTPASLPKLPRPPPAASTTSLTPPVATPRP